MNPLYIVGTATGGAIIGGAIGFWVGFREGGDFNFAPLFTGPVGALIGGFAGVVVGAALFS